jgi:quercetin dioxygenase-like cupin family protein
VDPQPSRWPWNGKRDPYDDADYSQFNELPLFGSGVQIAVLHGTLNEAVPFVAQVKFAAGVKVPAHSQSATRHLTVLSGVLNIGLGDGLDTSNTHALGPGSVTIIEPAINHFFWFSEETVVQLQGLGPLVVTYADPADDPREKYGPSVSAPP